MISSQANPRYHRSMSDSPYGGMPAGPTPRIPQGQLPSNGPSRVPLIIAIVVALLALALAAAAWFRPAPDPTPAAPQYSDQQVAEAKKNLCDAYSAAIRAINTAGSAASEDPNLKFVLAINTRAAFNTAADYLQSAATLNPAAPSNLLDQAQRLAASYQNMVLAQIAQAPKDELDPLYSAIDPHEGAIKEVCR